MSSPGRMRPVGVPGPADRKSVTSRSHTGQAGSSASTMWLLLSNATKRAPRMPAASSRLCRNSFI